MKEKMEALREKGVVLTLQRLAVLEFLEGKTTHPTVEEIHRELKKKYPTISQATVYSSLETLKEAGVIQQLTIRKERVCFDPNPEPHHHFFCRECSRVLDIDISCSVAERGWINGHQVEEVQAYFYGVCSRCLKKGRGRSSKPKGDKNEKGEKKNYSD